MAANRDMAGKIILPGMFVMLYNVQRSSSVILFTTRAEVQLFAWNMDSRYLQPLAILIGQPLCEADVKCSILKTAPDYSNAARSY